MKHDYSLIIRYRQQQRQPGTANPNPIRKVRYAGD
jgi:hypothetical protein